VENPHIVAIVHKNLDAFGVQTFKLADKEEVIQVALSHMATVVMFIAKLLQLVIHVVKELDVVGAQVLKNVLMQQLHHVLLLTLAHLVEEEVKFAKHADLMAGPLLAECF